MSNSSRGNVRFPTGMTHHYDSFDIISMSHMFYSSRSNCRPSSLQKRNHVTKFRMLITALYFSNKPEFASFPVPVLDKRYQL